MKALDGLVEVAGAPFTQRWNKRSIEFQAEAGRDGCGSRVAGRVGVGGVLWRRAWPGKETLKTPSRLARKHG